MDSSAEAPPPESDHKEDIAALSEAIGLAPLGVLPSSTIAQLTRLRARLIANTPAS